MDPAVLSAYASVAAAVLQIASVVAVVVSISLVGRQLRLNTQALQVATYQNDVSNTISILSSLYSSPEVADLQFRAHRDPRSLSPVDALRWDNYMQCSLRHFDSIYHQYRAGTLETDLWLGYRAAFGARLRNNGWRTWFEANKAYFSPALADLVADILASEHAAVSPK